MLAYFYLQGNFQLKSWCQNSQHTAIGLLLFTIIEHFDKLGQTPAKTNMPQVMGMNF